MRDRAFSHCPIEGGDKARYGKVTGKGALWRHGQNAGIEAFDRGSEFGEIVSNIHAHGKLDDRRSRRGISPGFR